jgi:YVTN family beta-propeller protein
MTAEPPEDSDQTEGALKGTARTALDLRGPDAPAPEPHLQRRSSRGSRRQVIVAGGLTAIAAVVLPVILSHGGEKPAATPSVSPRSSSSPSSLDSATGALLRIDPATNEVAAQPYLVGRDPTALAVGEGSVWVADAGDNSILRLDPATGRVQARIEVTQQPRGVAIGGGVPGVWVNTIDQVWKIDPRSNRVVLMGDLGEPSGAIATGEGSVWVTSNFFGLGKVDPGTGRLDPGFVGPIMSPQQHRARTGQPGTDEHYRRAPPSVGAGLGWVWAIWSPPPTGGSPVWRVDAATGSSTRIPMPFGPIGLAVGPNAVWAVGRNGGVAKIDPETSEVVAFIGTGNGVTQVAAGLGAVWVLNPSLGTVTRIEPGTDAVVATIDVGKGATALAAGEGSVWVTRRAG